MKRILALTTINNTIALKKAIESIYSEYGKIVIIKKIYFDEYETPDIDLKPIYEEIEKADIILVDIRGDIRLGRELPKILKDLKKTIVVLIAGTQKLFALTKMGKFNGEKIFSQETNKPFDIHAYVKAKRFSELTKKLGKIIPFGMLRDMRNWVITQQYYSEGDAENLKNMIHFLLKNYTDIRKIRKVPPPKRRPPFGLILPNLKNPEFVNDLEKYKELMNFDPKKPTIGVLTYNGMHFADTLPVACALYEYLKNETNFIIVTSEVEYNITAK